MTGPARRRPPAALSGLALLLGLYLTVPLLLLVWHAARPGPGPSGTGGLGAAAATSAVTASIATGVLALTAVPLGRLLAGRRGPAWGALAAAVQLPLALPPLVSGIALLAVVGPYTALGRLTGGRLTDSLAGIVLAQTFVAAPFVVIAARSAFASVDPALGEVAATAGIGRWGRLVRVELAVAGPAVAAGLVLGWLRAFGEFGATVILAYHPMSLPVDTFVQFDSTGLRATTAPAVTALAVAVAVTAATAAAARLRLPARRPPPAAAVAPRPRRAGSLAFAVARRRGRFDLALSYSAGAPRLALLGPSGAGKSTVLRALAGLDGPGPGDRVVLDGRDLARVPAEDRHVGYVPQSDALVPRRPVWAQLSVGPRADPAAAAWWLARLGLAGCETRVPAELSGGERRRVALARALSLGAPLVLLDEPFTGLDTPRRRQLRGDLRRLLLETGATSVLVTHDPEEAAVLADEVVVMADGRALQAGPVRAVFDHPDGPAVAELLGVANVGAARAAPGGRLQVGGFSLPARLPAGAVVGERLWWRAEPAAVVASARAGPGTAAGQVLDVCDYGTRRELTVAVHGGPELRGPAPDGLGPGDPCAVRVDPDGVVAWRPHNTPPPADAGPRTVGTPGIASATRRDR